MFPNFKANQYCHQDMWKHQEQFLNGFKKKEDQSWKKWSTNVRIVTTVFRYKWKIVQTTFIRNKICQERQTFGFSPAICYNYEYRLLTKVYYTTWDTYTELHAWPIYMTQTLFLARFFGKNQMNDVSKAPINSSKKIICSCFIRNLEGAERKWLITFTCMAFLVDPN